MILSKTQWQWRYSASLLCIVLLLAVLRYEGPRWWRQEALIRPLWWCCWILLEDSVHSDLWRPAVILRIFKPLGTFPSLVVVTVAHGSPGKNIQWLDFCQPGSGYETIADSYCDCASDHGEWIAWLTVTIIRNAASNRKHLTEHHEAGVNFTSVACHSSHSCC